MQDIRFVVFHSPGPEWLEGKTIFEQPGLQAHVDHYRQWLENGQLALGGPHPDERGGGMMVAAESVPRETVQAFAEADPAVRGGLLRAEVRPWLIGMKP